MAFARMTKAFARMTRTFARITRFVLLMKIRITLYSQCEEVRRSNLKMISGNTKVIASQLWADRYNRSL